MLRAGDRNAGDSKEAGVKRPRKKVLANKRKAKLKAKRRRQRARAVS